MQRQVDTIQAIDLARWTTQMKGVDASVIVTMDPEVLNPGQFDLNRLRVQLEAVAAGPNNAGKILFVPGGTGIEKMSNTPAEMAWTEGVDQLLGFILAAFGTPKSIAGLQDDTSYASLYASLKQFNIISLKPRCRIVSNYFSKLVLRRWFGPSLYMSLTPERIDDHELRERQLGTLIQVGGLTINELRKEYNMPPAEAKWGKDRAWVKNAPEQPGQPGAVPGQPGSGQKPAQEENPLAAVMGHSGDNGRVPGRIDKLSRDERTERREEERHTEQTRPKHTGMHHSLGTKKNWQEERLSAILERAKTNGYAKHVGKDDDGAEDFWLKDR
jgi:Phage portal protein